MNIRFFLATIALAAGALMAKDYKGGELYTKTEFQYGKFEARMKMAAASGTVSSMFLYQNGSEIEDGRPWVEVDIEILGQKPYQFQSNIITGKAGAQITSEKLHNVSPNADQAFHTYAIEWTPNYVRWTVDGVEVRKTEGGQVSNLMGTQGLRFNLWSSESESWVGYFDQSKLPLYQFINWVKVYEYKQGQGDNGSDFKLLWTDDFDSFNSSRWDKANWTFGGNRVDLSPSNIFIKDGMLILALTRGEATGYYGNVPQDTENNPQSSNSNNPGMSSSSQSQYNPGQSSSSQGQNYNPGLSSNSQNQNNNQNPYNNNTDPYNGQSQNGYVDPNGAVNGQTDAIRPAKVFRDSQKIRGTVNAKGARVSGTNRAHYQVDFNY